jgi:hypothetical protein
MLLSTLLDVIATCRLQVVSTSREITPAMLGLVLSAVPLESIRGRKPLARAVDPGQAELSPEVGRAASTDGPEPKLTLAFHSSCSTRLS